jgi:hypothetical protein
VLQLPSVSKISERDNAEILEKDWKTGDRLLIAGGNPGVAVLADHLRGPLTTALH